MTGYPSIEDLLPHRSPMILLHGVEDVGEETIVCSVKLHDGSPFVENGSVAALVAVEYMAQCVAAHAGFEAFRRGEPVRIGYLIGVRRMDLTVDEFVVPEELIVRAKRIWGGESLGQFECSVDARGRRAASALLNVFQGDIDALRTTADP